MSAYRHRFSVDADIVVSHGDAGRFEDALEKIGFRKTASRELENVYSSRFIRYEREEDRISVDVLVGGLGVRQTGAAFSFDTLLKDSKPRKITGTSGEATALVPGKETLIAMKLHSGRPTDLRDVVALSAGTDPELVKPLLLMGDRKRIKGNLERLNSILDDKGFIDSFKGVFMEKKYGADIEAARRICRLAEEL